MEFKVTSVQHTVDALSEGTVDGIAYRASVHQYGPESESCAGKWHWMLSVGALTASGILPAREQAEQACRESLVLLHEADELIGEVVDGIRDPQTSATCGSCDGSGEGSADGTRCSSCKGMGEVAA